MKKYCFFTVLLFTCSFVFGQSLDDINKFMLLQQNKKAKEMVDKFLTEPKNAAKGEGWYYKGRIYNALSKDSTATPSDAMKLKLDAFEAFKKYQQLDAKEESFIAEKHGSYFDLYNGLYDIGAKEFNGKNFANSFEGFKNALAVEDYVNAKGYDYNSYKFPKLDTPLVINTAVAANQAKNEDAAVSYYRKLTDASVSGQQYLNIYQYLVEYYNKKNDDANVTAMLAKGRSVYPNDDYWTDFELDKISKKGDKQLLMAKYKELIKANPTKFTYPYNLAVELYNQIYVGDKRPANSRALKDTLTEAIKTAIATEALDKKGIEGKTLMVRHLYNWAYDCQDSSKKIKGVKPADIKMRNDYKALSMKKIDECIPYANAVADYYAALPTLKPVQKANYKDVLDKLSQFYGTKGNPTTAAEYDKQKIVVDKSPTNFNSDNTNQNNSSNKVGSVKATLKDGIYTVPCKINGLALEFIYDSGASDVSISLTEAMFMLKNGFLDKSDITGSSNYSDANGNISIGTTIVIRKLEFGGLILNNVKASVVNNSKAPLLLGQSALSKFGKVTFDYTTNTLILGK